MKNLSLTDISADADADLEPGSLSKEEEKDLEREKAVLENDKLGLENKNLKQDIELRRTWIKRTFVFTAFIIAAVFGIILLDATCDSVNIDGPVLIALITGVAVESIGIIAIVTKYLFPS